jgi:hypothetical protein
MRDMLGIKALSPIRWSIATISPIWIEHDRHRWALLEKLIYQTLRFTALMLTV